jgi:hypothetical protein
MEASCGDDTFCSNRLWGQALLGQGWGIRETDSIPFFLQKRVDSAFVKFSCFGFRDDLDTKMSNKKTKLIGLQLNRVYTDVKKRIRSKKWTVFRFSLSIFWSAFAVCVNQAYISPANKEWWINKTGIFVSCCRAAACIIFHPVYVCPLLWPTFRD